ncbi:3-phenylpropionate/trans-cinnamate dioxygenase ferredoxin reductase subunit [Fluviicoccus keumensis]|uniref:3-phenylpropionate/trans-cinnamate dioxygenase ferredoxin reductase subunit n=1 Tax=Fluviicoccus keumensis TaxID=1435465 RepID=A0A4Q7YJW1_9GAMM|nr:FAD-dependent oxidoreductase [Fluviicoccus keumensis]RZU36775.1 3-phenylpropionate/trans-cinnamate dioxygenase ferredoxin reductase subunit [Fluviicoccus keumensis]
MTAQTAVIIGASHAAAQLSASLRLEGWGGDILVVGDEPYLPYQHPPLSKTFLSGDKTVADLYIRPAAFYEKNNIHFRQARVTAIDRARQQLTLDDGASLAYDKLALCLGARVRKAGLPGEALAGVHYLRTIADVQGIQPEVVAGRRAVIIGGGYIGLETAASLRKQGMAVVVLEMADRILQRVTAPELSEFYSRIHREEGVHIQTGISVTALAGDARVERVECANGVVFPADLVIIGVGVVPNVELAQAAGLAVDNGITVDEFACTNDPNIVAAGDCANHFNAIYQRRMRLESVPNAGDQAKAAAASLCGVKKAYQSLPWFWSDQYDLKLQIAGLSQGYDQVVMRGDPDNSRSFAAFYLKSGQLIAADCINRPQEFLLAKKIITDKLAVNANCLADETIAVKTLLSVV